MLDRSLRDGWTEQDGSWHFEMPTGWMQGRSMFGGMTAAAATALAHRHISEPRRLRTMTIQLLRPLQPGLVTGLYQQHRAGKNITFADVNIAQRDSVVALTRMVFADSRDDATDVTPSETFAGPPPDTLGDLPYMPGIAPEFTQNVEFRWITPGLPYTGSGNARIAGYCRFRVPFADIEGIIALLDAWPCPSLGLLRTPAPASTVQWTAHIARLPENCNGWFGFTYDTVIATGGYHTVVGRLYDPDGALIAWTEQLVAVFDREGTPRP